MNPFAETSFLCSLYRSDVFSPHADLWTSTWGFALPVSSLVLFEFRQSIRLQARMAASHPTIGLSLESAQLILRQQEHDLERGILETMSVDWPSVHKRAEALSERHTWTKGIRFADLLHVATALHLASDVFLTFDTLQAQLAREEGLKIPFAI